VIAVRRTNDRQRPGIVSEADRVQRLGRPIARASAIIAYCFLLGVEMVLAVGFFLHLLGADPSWPVVEWVYHTSDRFMRPFQGIFESVEPGIEGIAGNVSVDTAVLLAMLVYGIVALVLRAIVITLSDPIERTAEGPQPTRRETASDLEAGRP
jgi:hypothetical protein